MCLDRLHPSQVPSLEFEPSWAMRKLFVSPRPKWEFGFARCMFSYLSVVILDPRYWRLHRRFASDIEEAARFNFQLKVTSELW